MSIQARPMQEVPEETRRVAQAAFPKGNLYMRIRDELGEIYQDAQFADLFSNRGQPAEAPGRLALITVMQFAESKSDRQAAEAVRGRIDWKYALSLELTDPGFDYSILSEFRNRLLAGGREQELLDSLIEACKERGWLKARGQQRTDSTHILAAVRQLNRLELVGETMRYALNELAHTAPDWLGAVAQAEWFSRYAQRFDSIRLPNEPAKRAQLIEIIGVDGMYLLSVINEATIREQLQRIDAVDILRQIWLQQYWLEYGTDDTPHIRLRSHDNQPPIEQRIQSPYDVEARYGSKRTLQWVGYKAHLTETCEDDRVNLITHAETTSAAIQDMNMADPIHAALAKKNVLPSEHLMDAGYIDGELLFKAKIDLAVEVYGPVKKDVRWQAQAGQGFGLADFKIDWEHQTVTCPAQQQSSGWSQQHNAYGQPVIHVKFKPKICQACPSQECCTRSKRGARSLVLQPQLQHEALQQNRQAQQGSDFWKRYAKRSGIEGTISQAVRVCDLRRSRYIGQAKTRLQVIATATAINLYRLFDWLMEIPRSVTRISPFARLAPDPSLVAASWRF